MEKKHIETFIKKYNLGGLIEGVRWNNDSDNLVATAMTSDRKLFASVVWDKAATFFKDIEIGIQDTTKLKRMLAPLSENVAVSLDIDENDKTRVRQVIVDDGKNIINYQAAQVGVLDSVPKMKNIPTFDVEITLSPEFIDAYNKSFAALGDDAALFTLIMSPKKKKLEMVLGYKQNLSDRISLEVVLPVPGKATVKNPISFNAKHLKEVLSANSEVKNPVLNIAEAGLASISFANDGFNSQYYMIKIDVED
jgi:hypothetical protein